MGKPDIDNPFRCVLHGSFRQHYALIKHIKELFEASGIEVLALEGLDITDEREGFVFFEGEEAEDPRLIELRYLSFLKQLGHNGFSYFVNPNGYIGRSASYELGIAQATNVRCFFYDRLADHPAYSPFNTIWRPEALVNYIQNNRELPRSRVIANERKIHKLWTDLLVPGSIVAAGAITQYVGKNAGNKEVLLVKTHKWGHRYSIVGGRVNRNERLDQAILRELKEETGLFGKVGRHLVTFDQIKNSGYYQKSINHIFVDKVVEVNSRNVRLNEEAQEFVWAEVDDALAHFDIEPNARHTLEILQKV